jgi:hypothetical protein
MHIINLNTFSYRESILKEDIVLLKMSKNLDDMCSNDAPS